MSGNDIVSKISFKNVVIAAFAALTTFGAPAQAEVEYIPDPATILTNNAFTLGEPTTTKPTSGSYIVLSAIDKATNPWAVSNAYSTFTLNKTSYVYGDGPYTDLSTTINIPNSTQTITVKYTNTPEGNHARITNLSENISNTVFAQRSDSNGGAIKNTGSGSYNITNSAFLSNRATYSHGGAVYNSGKMGNITNSKFIQNSANGGSACGGGIANASGATIGDIKNNIFIGNTVKGDSGGAIINLGNAIMGDIENNAFISNDGGWSGGALFISAGAKVNSIKSSIFISNIAHTGGVFGFKGNVTNGISDSIFIDNKTQVRTDFGGGVLYLYNNAILGDISNCIFISNYTVGKGGVIFTQNLQGNPRMSLIKDSLFLNNSSSGTGGVLHNEAVVTNGIASSTFIANSGSSGGVIYNIGTMGAITNSTFLNNKATSGFGGAIYTSTALTIGAYEGKTTSFVGNTASSQGGAIWASNNLTFNANNGTITFQDNKAGSNSNAIYFSGSRTANFNISNGGSVYMYDKIDGATGYNVVIQGANAGADKMYLFNDINNANVSLGGVELNTINNNIHEYNFNTLNLANDFNMAVDVDLENESMDRLIVGDGIDPDLVTGSGKINVVGMNLLTDAVNPDETTRILFANDNLKANVVNKVTQPIGGGISNLYQTTAFAPIYKYDAIYNPEDGYYSFAKSTGGGGGSDSFNPAVLAEPVAAQAQVMAINNIVTNYAFHHVDTNFLNGSCKLSSRYANRYAIAETDLIKDDLNTNNPLFIEPDKEAVWVKPFVTFENIPLKNGPKVNNITYGTLIGFDSPVFHHKRGFDGIWTGYVGYNGSNMHYSGVDSTSNGGLFGATYSLYKGNFFNATTVTTGAMNTQARTMYGNDNMTSLYAGIGNKTGYNFNFKEGLFTIQPSFLISYTFGKTFDYTNAAGVRIDSDPSHAIQLSPGIKFFMNTKNGWQPYIGVNMMWNIMDQTHARANGVKLPEMSVKPYVQYGIGVQKVMKDHFTAYGQAMIQNGGRNGISLTFGFKWALGRDHKKIEKVHSQDIKRTVIKDKKIEKV